MDQSQFENFIRKKGYKTSNQFNNNPKDLLRVINFIKNLPVSKDSFQILEALLKFYRTPLFIVCQDLYQKTAKTDQKIVIQFEENIKQIANYVKNYLGQYNLQQLSFFYFLGISKKKKKIPEKSDGQIQFLKYIESLGKQLQKIKRQINQIGPQKLKLQLDAILAGGLQRKLNTLEQYYEQYFKNQADKIYRQHRKTLQDSLKKYQQKNKYIQPLPEIQQQKRVPLCCRTFFYDGQIIKQPQNLTIQYKNYIMPFGDNQIKILKKTICAFLNTDGGTIFLGIQQHVDTKKRKIIGNQLNQFQKQNLLFILRKDIIDSIKPDILSNKMYWVNFVPVKQKSSHNHYISGRYITKITIKFGLRNEIYSYRHQNRDYFSFRTQNQVIHRQGRQILNAYRQRLKNPLPIPIPLHEGPCASPEQGNPITAQRKSKEDYPTLIVNSNQKKKYKEKDAMDFILFNITQKDLVKQINLQNLMKGIYITSEYQKNICFIKIVENSVRQRVISVLSKMQSKNYCQFYQTQRGILSSDSNLDLATECLQQNGIKFTYNEKRKVFQFKSTQQSIQAFLILKQMTFGVSFIAV